jgi:hypothetical protein
MKPLISGAFSVLDGRLSLLLHSLMLALNRSDHPIS